ncbi:MAG: Hsp70 family protein [Mycobacterium sp.]|nr:Hsp70 family protein [Mycobacterium sp.]
MADEQRPAIGLSIGATNLAAVTAERAVTRKPVLTLHGQQPPEVGVPSENPKLTEPGLVITDFVDRVGDPAGIVASDGSAHRAETLLADGLRALAYTATDGRTLPMAAVTYPAHWGHPAVDALRSALGRVPEWSAERLWVLSDVAAALTALQADPGLPTRGIIAVCDFGGSGTSLTLIDAANGYQPVAPTVRHVDFSGNQIDQALLNHVVADVSSADAVDTSGTATIGSVTALRGACQRAKEELSSTTSTTVTVDLRGNHSDIRITRAELDDLIRPPLDGFVNAIRETLQRNGIQPRDVAAVASVGGGASIPAVTTTLSEQLRVPVIAAPRPLLTPAIGAALTAARGLADDGATALAPTAGSGSPTEDTAMTEVVPEPSSPEPALAWSESDDASDITPMRTGEYPIPRSDGGARTTRPQPTSDHTARRRQAAPVVVPLWYRRPGVVIIGTALVVLAIGAAILIALRHTSGPTTPSPGVNTTPGSSAPGTESSGPSATTESQAPGSTPPSSSSTESPSPSTTTQAPSTTTQAPTTTSQPSTTQAPTTTAPATTASNPPTSAHATAPLIPRIPGLLPPPAPPGG